MPTNNRGRPPGRRDGCRPPEGRSVPPKSKRTDALAAVPDAKKAAAYLKRTGETELAQAVRTLIAFTAEAGERAAATAAREADLSRNRALHVHRDFRDRVNHLRDGVTLPEVLVPYLERFVAGTWTPARPRRISWGSPGEKVAVNVRIADGLWDAVDRRAKDPEESGERGYKLTAIQVAIAALREEYGEPAEDDAATA